MNRLTWLSPLLIALSLIPASAAVSTSAPQSESQSDASARGPGVASLSRDDVEPFLDGLVASEMAGLHIPGAVVTVVADGEVLIAKGYGYGTVEPPIPVSPERTLFHLASISKVFVWTAVMQLVEQGTLDLSQDINTYLGDDAIPMSGPVPISLLDLMDHTAGFEERALGTSERVGAKLQPLTLFLRTHRPNVIYPPGTVTAYSNYGAALAGEIVSRMTGRPFEAYVERTIFEPLDMRHSTFRQPVPAELADDLANGYRYVGGAFERQEPEWVNLGPAAALRASADDIATFMLAQLGATRGDRAPILAADTLRTMQGPSFRNDPRVQGMAHGYLMARINGERIIWHGGDVLAFHSGLVLLPDRHLGLFVSFNSSEAAPAVLEVIQAFLNRYFPAPRPTEATPSRGSAASPDPALVGTFLPTRSETTTAGRLMELIGSVTVQEQGGDRVRVTLGSPAQMTGIYEFTAPGVAHPISGDLDVFGDLVLSGDKLMFENNPTLAYIRAPWYVNPTLQFGALGCAVFALVSGLWLVWDGRRLDLAFGDHLGLPWWVMAATLEALCLIGLATVAGLAAVFSTPDVVFGLPPWSVGVFWLPVPLAILSMASLLGAIRFWVHPFQPLRIRVHVTLVALGGAVLVLWLWYWNLWAAYLY